MAFDVEGARKAGYSDAEIADHLAAQSNFNTKGARDAGYTDAELIQHLSAPAKAAPAPPAKPKGLGDRIKAMATEGVNNLSNEAKHPLDAIGHLAIGVGKGAMDMVDGGAQLLARAASGAASKFAPGTALDRAAQGELKNVETINQDREDKYQDATKGSVLAGVGRVGGNAILPGGSLARIERGAKLVKKVGSAAQSGALAGVLQPVYDVTGKDGTEYAKEKAGQVAAGAVLGGVAPVAGKLGLEAASKLGSKKAEQVLTDTRKAQLFDKSPNAKADAEVITELGGINDRIGDRKMLTHDINARQVKIAAETQDALKAIGATPEQLTAFKNWQGLTSAEREAMRKTPQGNAVADIIGKLDRVRGLTPGELANNIGSVPRALVDLAPLPRPAAWGLKNLLGGRITRNATAEQFLDPRSQAAAQQYLAANGASDATKGLQTLKQMADAAKAAKAAEAAAKAAQAAQDAEGAKALQIAARKISRTPGGGAYQAVVEHTGRTTDEVNQALRIARRIPEAAQEVEKIRQGGNTKDGAIYPITDIVKTIAEKLNPQSGALSQELPAGVLSNTAEPLTARYQMATQVRQGIIKDAITKASEVGSTEARKAAIEVGGKLKSTPKRTDRIKLIDDLEAQHPETKGLFSEVRHLK